MDNKRLWILLYFVVAYLLILPLCLHLSSVSRADVPLSRIRDFVNNLPLNRLQHDLGVQVVFVNDINSQLTLQQGSSIQNIQTHLSKDGLGSCTGHQDFKAACISYEVRSLNEWCGAFSAEAYESLTEKLRRTAHGYEKGTVLAPVAASRASEDDALDEALSGEELKGWCPGLDSNALTVFLFEQFDRSLYGSDRIVVGTRRSSWILITADDEDRNIFDKAVASSISTLSRQVLIGDDESIPSLPEVPNARLEDSPDSLPASKSKREATQAERIQRARAAEQDGRSSQLEIELPLSSRYRLSFRLWNEECGVVWDFPSLFERSQGLSTFVRRVSDVAEFSYESQILHYVPLSLTPRRGYWTPDGMEPSKKMAKEKTGEAHPTPRYYYEESDLPYVYPSNLLNSDFTTFQPAVHFVTYIPVPERPLHTLLSSGSPSRLNSFLIPQTGAFTILNLRNQSREMLECQGDQSSPGLCQCQLPQDAAAHLSALFIQQFRQLLDIPSAHSLFQNAIDSELDPYSTSDQKPSIFIVPSGNLRLWELDRLVRKRVHQYYMSAAATLQSLDVVLTQFENIVVPDSVMNAAESALSHLETVTVQIGKGNSHGALAASRQAMQEAESAFYSENMLSQLYFPTEHRIAVFVPLLLPALFPVVTKLLQEISHLREKQKKKANKKANKQLTETKKTK